MRTTEKDQADYIDECDQMKAELKARGVPIPGASYLPGTQVEDIILTHAGLCVALSHAQAPTGSASSTKTTVEPGDTRNWTDLAARARRGETVTFGKYSGLTSAVLRLKGAKA